MKKQILIMALAMAMIGGIAAGCSSDKAATGSSDSTMKMDSSSKMKPDSTMKPDTMKKDTTKTPPM